MKEIELLKQKIWFTCWCINTKEAYNYISIIEERIKELEEIEFRYNDLCN